GFVRERAVEENGICTPYQFGQGHFYGAKLGKPLLWDIRVRSDDMCPEAFGQNFRTPRADIAQSDNANCFALDFHPDHGRTGIPGASADGARSLCQLPAAGHQQRHGVFGYGFLLDYAFHPRDEDTQLGSRLQVHVVAADPVAYQEYKVWALFEGL